MAAPRGQSIPSDSTRHDYLERGILAGVATPSSNTRAVFLFHDTSELRWVSKAPRHGVRVRSNQGTDWIIDDVVRTGVDTYTVTCVAPGELADTRERAVAYLRRDREFLAATLFWSALVAVLLSQVANLWASLVVVGLLATVACFAWATK